MGFFDSLFGKKEQSSAKVSKPTEKANKAPNIRVEVNVPEKKKPTQKIQSLLLLFYAEKFNVDQKDYPGYIVYHVDSPEEKFEKLKEHGYIRPASATESINNLKVPQLKEIAASYGVKTTGKKADICQRLVNELQTEELEKIDVERRWVLTDKGQEELSKNPYVAFCLEKHPYTLNNIDLDISAVAKLYNKYPSMKIRDLLWGEFNRVSTEYYIRGVTKGEFHKYCDLLYIMAMFLEEEGKHLDALHTYMRYIFFRNNFEAGFNILRTYKYYNSFNDALDNLVMNTEIYQFMVKDITSICDGCGYDSKQLRDFAQNIFIKEKDKGMFLSDELADIVIAGINGDKDRHRSICQLALKRAIKQLKK